MKLHTLFNWAILLALLTMLAVAGYSQTVPGPEGPPTIKTDTTPAVDTGTDPRADEPRIGTLILDPIKATLYADTAKAKQITPDRIDYSPATEPPSVKAGNEKKFHWKPAITQSLLFLAIQHGYRVANEEKTRRELKGPFFHDWRVSVSHLKGWDDGGRFFTNYVAHPLHGSITNRIFINNSDTAKVLTIGDKGYLKSRLKAMAWTAVWSAQFELGPISETSIGNVGKDLLPNGRSKETWEDLVNTPLIGTGVTIAEDAIDKYILANWLEKRVKNRVVIKILRSVLTPTMGFSNLLRPHGPWWRDTRGN